MKKIFCLVSFISYLFVSHANAALFSVYTGAELSAGKNVIYIPENPITGAASEIKKSANSYGLFLGVEIPTLRAELEYMRLNSDTVDLSVGMLNGYFKLFPGLMIMPYVGAGIGTSFSGSVDNQDTSTSMALQGMVGLQFSLPTTSFYFDIEGRVFYASDIYEIPGTGKNIGFLEYDVRAKVRYAF